MTKKVWWGWGVILLALLFPPAAQAQTAPQFRELAIEIWPEFDRPETLVIYRATLNADTALPAKLTFQLPGYVESMHAVAVEQNGGLVDVPPEVITMRREGDNLFLTFTTPEPDIQFEYYDPMILSKNGAERELAYTFTAPYNIAGATIQMQQPAQATNFSLTPPAANSFGGQDSLTYHNIQLSDLTAGDTFNLTAGYSRPTDELSVTQITLNPPPPAQGDPVVPTTIPTSAQTVNWGYALIGAGVVLLLMVGGYWGWLQQRANSGPSRRPARSRRSQANAGGGYCYRCGAALRADAQFCHQCGAERRR